MRYAFSQSRKIRKNTLDMRVFCKSLYLKAAPFLSSGHPSPGGGRNTLWSNNFPCPLWGKGIEG